MRELCRSVLLSLGLSPSETLPLDSLRVMLDSHDLVPQGQLIVTYFFSVSLKDMPFQVS